MTVCEINLLDLIIYIAYWENKQQHSTSKQTPHSQVQKYLTQKRNTDHICWFYDCYSKYIYYLDNRHNNSFLQLSHMKQHDFQ